MAQYEQAAQLGEAQAMWKMAGYLQRGGLDTVNEGRPDPEQAYTLLQQAADQNSKEALRDQGYIYEKGGMLIGSGASQEFYRLGDVDLDKALICYQQAAQMGDPLALNYLGSFYFNHTKDFPKAVKAFREAADKSDLPTSLLLNGAGADKKCARALNNLAQCFEMG